MRIRFFLFFVVYVAITFSLSLVPPAVYAGVSLRPLGLVLDDIVGSLFAYSILPCAVLFFAVPVICKSVRESLVIGAVALPLQAAGAALSTYARNQGLGHYATPVATVDTHFLTTLVVSAVLFSLIAVFPTSFRSTRPGFRNPDPRREVERRSSPCWLYTRGLFTFRSRYKP
jgi:hypothetical protein